METSKSYPRKAETPNLHRLKHTCQKQCEKCLRPVDPECDICTPGGEEDEIITQDREEESGKSIFDVLWRNCTSRAFESKKRRLG